MFCFKLISECTVRRKKNLLNRKILGMIKAHNYASAVQNPDEESEEFFKKIIYNEVLNKDKPFKHKSTKIDEPLCLKYLVNESNKKDVEVEKKETEVLYFPYEVKNKYLKEVCDSSSSESFVQAIEDFTPSDNLKINVPQWKSKFYQTNFRNYENPVKWVYTDDVETNDIPDVYKFGSCNPHSKVSKIPCGGCGALLHCNNATLPGFIPAEIFENRKENSLRGELCQRCHFLKEFSVPLGVNVSPSEYTRIISAIKEKKALALIMIDLLDFPCSIFPGIFDLIGPEKPVVIIGNKVDLLIKEGNMFLTHFKQSLMSSLNKQKLNLKNIQHVFLISAKTGYGVENLVDLLFEHWQEKGDVYLIGCTNVGKSTLFNSLIQSDYCRLKAAKLLQRATVSNWPGTTLNLLKFPIAKGSQWRLAARSARLSLQEEESDALQRFQTINQKIMLEQIPLQGYIARTLGRDSNNSSSLNSSQKDKNPRGIHPLNSKFLRSNWFYDTPGVVNEDQIVNLLTTAELLLTVPKKMLLPRNFLLNPGTSLFIAGLARLDFISGAESAWFTVYASMELPITITKLEDAYDVYNKFLGSPFFRVPTKGKNRLEKWPKLSSKKFEIVGKIAKDLSTNSYIFHKKFIKEADVDIVLSSAGWVSVAAPQACLCKVEAWTPEGRGIYLRNFPIIRRGHAFKGEKIPGTPAFKTVMKEVKGYSVNDRPPF